MKNLPYLKNKKVYILENEGIQIIASLILWLRKYILNFIISGIRDNIDVIRGKVKTKHISPTTMKWLVWRLFFAITNGVKGQ